MDEHEIPEGWERTTIGQIAEINPSKPPASALPADAPVTFVPMPAVSAESGTIEALATRGFHEVRKGYTAFREGDVLFAKITPCMENGKAAIARDLANGLGFGSSEFHVLRASGAVLPEFLHRFVRQQSFRDVAESNMGGSVGQQRVPESFLDGFVFDLPPLAEQHRILAKLDEVLSGVNASRDRLAWVPGILKRFRQAVLAAACSGRLTEAWRAQQGSDGGDGDGFPPGWTSATLGELSSLVTSGSRGWAKYYAGSGAIFIRSQDISTDELLLDDVAHVSVPQSAEGARTRVQQADLLVTITGANVAKAARVTTSLDEAYVSQHVALIRPHDPSTSPFLHLWLRSTEHARGELLDLAYGAGKPGLNLSNIRDVRVVLPPAPERDEIVRRVDAFLVLADSIESRVAAANARADRLTQAVLAKAFRGELVPTEAELARQDGRPFESADELLARIRATLVEARPKRSLRGRRRSSST